MIATAMRVLVVEDERDLADAVVRGLSRSGFAVDLAPDGAQALEKTWASDYDVIVLDRDLPEVHGDEVCRRLAGDGSLSRILMLTAARPAAAPGEGPTLRAPAHPP